MMSNLNKLLTSFLFVFLLFCVSSYTAWAQELPQKENKLVYDYAGALNPDEQWDLEQKLVQFYDSTSTQIAIVILKTLNGYPIADYAFKLGETWGIGGAGNNNGALVLIAFQDRKAFIATGRGLEAVIPDALCKRIIENDLKPSFKQQAYYQGLDKTTNTLMSLAKGEFTADQYAKTHDRKATQKGSPWIFVLIVVAIIVIVLISKATSTRRYASTNNIPFWVAWGLLNAMSNRRNSSWGDFTSGSGRFGGGSDDGSSGGGFDGFGGGSFGGGGAGGDW